MVKTGNAILGVGAIVVGGYLLWKILPYAAAGGLVLAAVDETKKAAAVQEQKATEASKVSVDIGTPTVPAPVTYHYDYRTMANQLPLAQGALVTVGSAVSEWTGLDATKKGAALRSQFETKMIQNEGTTARFNELNPNNRIFVRLGEGVSNIFGFSPYQLGFDIKNKGIKLW